MSREQDEPGEQPVSRSDASGFTQLFGKTPLATDQTAQPFAPTKASTFSLQANPSESPTQIFAAIPPLEKPRNSVAATDETRIFSTATAPRSATLPKELPNSGSPPLSRVANEFTSVFQPIAPPPAMPAPPVAVAIEQASGEFTQFFSAVSMRANAVEQPVAPARSVPPVKPPEPRPTTEGQAGDFTQLFQQRPVPQTLEPAVVDTPSMKQAGIQEAQPDSFTQMFPQPPLATPFAAPPMSAASQAQAAGTPSPIFGEATPRGSFTDIFAAKPAPQAAPEPASAGVAAFFAGELPPLFTPPAAAKPVGLPPAFGALAPAEPASMPTATPGEFTRLMQSLEHPASATPPAPAQPLPLDASFFGVKPTSAGESEYTRVLRGGATGSAAGAAMAPPIAGSSATPGLALAPALAPEKENRKQDPEKPKPKPLVILLVVMNVLLLVALLVLGLVLLRRR